MSANTNEASFWRPGDMEWPILECENTVKHRFGFTNMGFAFPFVGNRDAIHRGCDKFVQRKALDYADEGTNVVRQILEKSAVSASGSDRTGSGVEVENLSLCSHCRCLNP